MPIRKRVQRANKRTIFKLWVLDERKPRAQFVVNVPYEAGQVICGGKNYEAHPTEIETIPYQVDIRNDGWADYTSAQFKRAMGAVDGTMSV